MYFKGINHGLTDQRNFLDLCVLVFLAAPERQHLGSPGYENIRVIQNLFEIC